MKLMKKFITTILSIILLCGLFCFVFKIFYDRPTFQKEDKVTVYLDGISDEQYNHMYSNEQVYISSKYLKDKNLFDYYWDSKYNQISVFNDFNYEVISYNDEKAFYKDTEYNIDDVLLVDNNELYLNISFIKDNYNDQIYLDKENLNVIIETYTKEYRLVRNSKLKWNMSGKKGSKKLEKNENVYVYDNKYKDDILVRTDDNSIGYMKLSDLSPVSKEIQNNFVAVNKGREINLAWDLIHTKSNNFKPFNIPEAVDIIAPTWYKLEDTNDLFKDLSNDEYTNYVKKMGREVWAVFSNSFDPDLTEHMLNDPTSRSKIADKIIEITKNKNYDGINIDFENIYMADKDAYSAFIKELYCKSKLNNIVMSVDITILSNAENWSLCFDRQEIGKYSDYVMLMAYDENVSGAPGSVSSIPWVDYGVKNLLEDVPKEKIVLGIPFYTRLWEQYDVDGVLKTKSSALRLKTCNETIEELGIELSYDETTGQNYGTKTIDNIKYIIWNEDETSLKNRMDIVQKYNLIGKAAWALDYGVDEMWDLIK